MFANMIPKLLLILIFYCGYIEAIYESDRTILDTFSSLQDQLRSKRNDVSKIAETIYYRDLLSSFMDDRQHPESLSKRSKSLDDTTSGCKERSNIKYTSPTTATLDVRFPSVHTTKDDSYLCTGFKVPFVDQESFIVKFTPHADMGQTHHMLVFGCDVLSSDKPYWNCFDPCPNKQTIYAWARNAPELTMPKDVGYSIGRDSKIRYVAVQMHFAKKFDEGTCAGVSAEITTQQQKYYAGIFLMAAYSIRLPPHTNNVPATAVCMNPVAEPMHVFAFRTHAHNLANVITGYRIRDMKYKMIGKGNPKWPQSFYPRVGGEMILQKNDVIAARCIYNNTGDKYVQAGPASSDEMCNLYLMFYTSDKSALEKQTECWGMPNGYKEKDVILPSDVNDMPPYPGYAGEDSIEAIKDGQAVVPLIPAEHMHMHHANVGGHEGKEMEEHGEEEVDEIPVYVNNQHNNMKATLSQDKPLDKSNEPHQLINNSALLSRSHGMPKYQGLEADLSYPQLSPEYKIGQVGGLVADEDGSVHVFHRADRTWTGDSFDLYNRFTKPNQPITKDTIYHLSTENGSIIHSWGAGQFFMPHGISLDSDGNMWLTDVALHQVLKYPPGGADKPLLTLGVRMTPGKDVRHFCKPTDVAVDSDGMVYISDGYCNGRVIKFDKDGTFMKQWGRMVSSKDLLYPPPPEFTFFVAHNIILCGPEQAELCVADRENGRIQCFTKEGKLTRVIQDKRMGSRVFAIAYSPLEGGVIYGVNGASRQDVIGGFTLQYVTGQFLERWEPSASVDLTDPHDITASPSGKNVYVGDLSGKMVYKFHQVPSAAPSSHFGLGKASLSPAEPPAEMPSEQSVDNLEKIDKKSGLTQISEDQDSPTNGANMDKEVEYEEENVNSSQAATVIIVILIALPTLSLVIAFVCIRIRAKRLQEYESLLSSNGKSNKKLNLGKFLKPAERKGFTRVQSVASDEDEDEVDSDVEIYSKKISRRPKKPIYF